MSVNGLFLVKMMVKQIEVSWLLSVIGEILNIDSISQKKLLLHCFRNMRYRAFHYTTQLVSDAQNNVLPSTYYN